MAGRWEGGLDPARGGGEASGARLRPVNILWPTSAGRDPRYRDPMAEWEGITRVDQEAQGVDPQDPDLVIVDILLNRQPPREWVAYFERQSAEGCQDRVGPPQLAGDAITIRATVDELKTGVTDLDQRIAEANDYYATVVLPSLGPAVEAETAQRAARSKLVDEAQRILDEL